MPFTAGHAPRPTPPLFVGLLIGVDRDHRRADVPARARARARSSSTCQGGCSDGGRAAPAGRASTPDRRGAAAVRPRRSSSGRSSDSFRKLDPRTLLRNPVIFVVEVVSAVVTDPARRRRRPAAARSPSTPRSPSACGSRCCSRTSPRRWRRDAARRRPSRLRKTRADLVARRLTADGREESVPASDLRARRPRHGRGRRADPGRRRDRRGDRLRRRVGDHRRVGAGDPRVRRRPIGASRAARRCCRTGSRSGSPSEPGEAFIDRMIAARRGRRAAEDAERDRAVAAAGRSSRSSS